MQYDKAQTAIEVFVKNAWTVTAVQYDNVAFNSDIYTEFGKLSVLFGEGEKRTVTADCFRQFGVIMFGIFVKPATGTARMNQLAAQAADMLKAIVIPPVASGPSVKCKVPSINRNLNERDGWVMAQVSCPFYYDI